MNKLEIFLISIVMCGCTSFSQERTQTVLHTPSGFNTYYVSASFGGLREDALFDSGSGYVVLAQSAEKNLIETGKLLEKAPLEGTLADGSALVVKRYTLSDLRIEECTIRNIDVVVFPKNTRSIIGLNALSLLRPFTITEDNTLLFTCPR